MARFPIPALWPTYLASPLVFPRASAWTLLWRNETTRSSVEDGQSAQNCTPIWHQKNEEFSWDPEGPWCLKFYSDNTCEDSNGITCEGYKWKQPASQNISAFSVYPMPPASVTAFGFASSTAVPSTTATTTPSSTNTGAEEAEVTEELSSDGSSLSGGAIAGIVVGVVVAVAFLCAACFYLGRRTGRKAATAAAAATANIAPRSDSPPPAPLDANTNPSSPPSEDASSSPTLAVPGQTIAELPKPPMVEIEYVPPSGDHQPPNGTRMIELPGPNPEVELSNTRQVQEMGVTRQIQELEGHSMERRVE
ncbi:uncharacterized protein DSM5745_05704 [Aspergillus mulundensis]|uniref:Uncharacterized protein n=1 Tax=Aspergillus mulundensis TaxID=1810919 RepID=A0A3D8RXS0_9EURO|nr:Uncharacterized protein DSM5745_05704 [Aspergillus mulundensis]RDW78852.1 Uncharacterized protein DSM5745_05704 [Aspergillus mulundensis]